MGLPKFVKNWLGVKSRNDHRYKYVLPRGIPKVLDFLALDINGEIHHAIAGAWGIGKVENPEQFKLMLEMTHSQRFQEIIKVFIRILKSIVKIVKPGKLLILAVDGVAPCSKLKQQRERRFKSAATADGTYPDTSFVTPGTDFMTGLDVAIRNFIIEKRHILPPTVVYSGHLTPGEGEHKIMSYFRKRKTPFANGGVVYGLDADLIMLSMLSPQDKIYLMRENPNNVINIDALKDALIQSVPDNLKPTYIHDFVALVLNIGNDFLPHGPLHNSIYTMIEGFIEAYIKVGKPLSYVVTPGKPLELDLKVMAEIMAEFGLREATAASREAILPDPEANLNRFVRAGLRQEFEHVNHRQKIYFDYEVFRSVWYNHEFMPVGQESQLGYLPVPGIQDVEEMCLSYTAGLLWVFRYYQTKTVNQRWYYPFNHPPLKTDLSQYLSGIDDKKRELLQAIPTKAAKLDYSPLEQLLAVIHPKSANVSLPDVIRHLALDPRSPICDHFQMSVIVEKDGISDSFSYTFRGIISNFNMDRIKLAVSQTDLRGQDFRWLERETIVDHLVGDDLVTWKNHRKQLVLKIKQRKLIEDKKKELNRQEREAKAKALKDLQDGKAEPVEEKKMVFPVIKGGGELEKDIRGTISKAATDQALRKRLGTQFEGDLASYKEQTSLEESTETSTPQRRGGRRGRGGRGVESGGRGSEVQSRRGGSRGGRGGRGSSTQMGGEEKGLRRSGPQTPQ